MTARKTTAKGTPRNGDTPFTFTSRTGAVITIPAGTVFDPDMDAFVAMKQAADDQDDLALTVATLDMVKSGFPSEVADQIRLKASELQEFTSAFAAHTGVDIPKS